MKFRLGPEGNWHGMAGLDFILQVVVTLNYFSAGKILSGLLESLTLFHKGEHLYTL